ncbi:MAG: hypothetical protein HY459_02070 [Parcubacteria group bacterium]|nr:hypothetical protein [Parcubacteria group bacterium]
MFPNVKASYTALILLATAFQTTSTGEAKAQSTLPEMSRPERNVGFQYLTVDDKGEETTTTLVGQTDTTIDWKRSNGCSWSELKHGFAPNLKWQGCGSTTDAEQTVKLHEGQPYPLKVGNSWTYYLDGRNINGNTWSSTRSCKVEGVVKVTVPLGTFDTFEVVCEQQRSTRKYYISPEHGLVRFIWVHQRRGTTSWELKKILSTGSAQ